jgi:ubiquinone/menaquinone biosynthesis C-methylase UbiE
MPTINDAAFTGAVANMYERYLVPLFFEPYAKDIANRLMKRKLSAVLETAAGTGVVTRAMDELLPAHVEITATDLNPDMLNEGAQKKSNRDIKRQATDAMQLPFADETFDAVVCQFGVMFFPDRAKAYAEAYRVLKPGGIFIFNAWDDLIYNDFSRMVNDAMTNTFPNDPPRFLPRTPYSYHNEAQLAADLKNGGFKNAPRFETINFRTTAESPNIAGMSICYGTPLRAEIDKHGPGSLEKAAAASSELIAQNLSAKPTGKLQAKIVEVEK